MLRGVRPNRLAFTFRRHSAGRSSTTDGPDLASLLEEEIGRARRHEWSFGAIVFGGLTSEAVESVQASIRATDRTATGTDSVVALLPETDAAGLRVACERLTSLVDIDPAAVVAVSFPDDALTVGRLCELLDMRLKSSYEARRKISGKRVVAA